MYDPKGNSKRKAEGIVEFTEISPPTHLSRIVHRFLEIKTTAILSVDYEFHALPDACTYVVFDQTNTTISGVTKIQASSQELNLGREFHYINVRLLPGVWRGPKNALSYGMVSSPYEGPLPLQTFNQRLKRTGFRKSQSVLCDLTEYLLKEKLVSENITTQRIFRNIEAINSVSEMAGVVKLSTRQLQRVLKQTTGFTPHDFLKIIRLQKTLQYGDRQSYADQSHFIHSFRKATGYTPGEFAKKFDV